MEWLGIIIAVGYGYAIYCMAMYIHEKNKLYE